MPAPPTDTIRAALAAGGARGGPALVSLDHPGIGYAALDAALAATAAALAAAGLGRGDRVALVLEDGLDAAIGFLGVASAATCAPLNPAFRERELRQDLANLRASAVVVSPATREPARRVARELGLAVLEVRRAAGEPGASRLRILDEGPARPRRDVTAVEPDDVALVLQTSGTTARPKVVPLTHRNLLASARRIAETLRLDERDRCLGVMPLFHIHGLVAACLATLVSGGTLVATPGFVATRFFAWLRRFRPTWYTAVPTIHQAVLARARDADTDARDTSLRFVRSSSAALPPAVARALEEAFGVPVVEAYGMTEASHQIASNPLPPGERRPGSVGPAAGPRVAVLDADGKTLGSRAVGEVAIDGPGVTAGYEGRAPEGDRSGPWFRTGDLGYLDDDGYLFLTGRKKEIINRGGESLSPREIDEVLLEHPDVERALAFAVPDARLGEDVAAAVVLTPGARADEESLAAFVAERLSTAKVPRRFVFLDELPKGPTGKVQRIGLAERLWPDGVPPMDAAGGSAATPALELEAWLALFEEVLGRAEVGPDDDFFALGGDSVLATTLALRVFERTGDELPMHVVFRRPTPRALAGWRAERRATETTRSDDEAAGREDDLPLTPAQAALRVQETLVRGVPLFNRPAAIRIRGPLDTGRLEASLAALARRHPPLRSAIEGTSRSARFRPLDDARWPLVAEPTPAEAGHRPSRLAARATALAEEPFDLAAGPLMRAALLRFDTDDHGLVLSLHHAAFDAWSAPLFVEELATCYAGDAARLRRADHARFLQHARARATEDAAAAGIDHWTRVLAGAPPLVTLPARHAIEPRTWRAAAERAPLPRGAVGDLATRAEVTPFMTLTSGLAVLLHALAGVEDVVVGTWAAGRDRPGTAGLIGLLVNSLPLRLDLTGAPTFLQVQRRVRSVALDAYAHQDVPFESVLARIDTPVTFGRNPLFNVVLQLRTQPATRVRRDELEWTEVPTEPPCTPYDLTVEVDADERVCFRYAADRFDAAEVRAWLAAWVELWTALATDRATTLADATATVRAALR